MRKFYTLAGILSLATSVAGLPELKEGEVK